MKKTFTITADTAQEELVAHCVSNNVYDIGHKEREKLGLPFKIGSFGVTRDYDLSNWTWMDYRGFAVEVHWMNDRREVKAINSKDCLPQYKREFTITSSTKCDPADKPFFCASLPAFEGVAGVSSADIKEVCKAIDKAIANGEKYWGWTDSDRTTHLIKVRKGISLDVK